MGKSNKQQLSEMLWQWTNYRVIAIKDDMFDKEQILNMLADLHDRLSKLEDTKGINID